MNKYVVFIMVDVEIETIIINIIFCQFRMRNNRFNNDLKCYFGLQLTVLLISLGAFGYLFKINRLIFLTLRFYIEFDI